MIKGGREEARLNAGLAAARGLALTPSLEEGKGAQYPWQCLTQKYESTREGSSYPVHATRDCKPYNQHNGQHQDQLNDTRTALMRWQLLYPPQ